MPPAGRPRTATSASDAPRRRSSERGRGRSRRGRSDLLARIAVAVPGAIIAIVFVDLGGTAWMALMILLGLISLGELYRMLHRWRPVSLVGFAALAGMCLAARYGSQHTVLEVQACTIPVLFLALLARGQGSRGATVAIAGTLLGVVWIGTAFSHAVLLREVSHGKGIIIDTLVGTFLGDTGAYIGGRLFGRRPLAPAISPHKTVEGLVIGMIAAIVGVYFASLYQSGWMTHGTAFVLGAAIAVLGPLGDLFESLVKRDAGTKDTGSLFGAHGGALDRLDSLLFTIVAAYYIWIAAPHP
jgi:phosphatidate cytidylyltransferase